MRVIGYARTSTADQLNGLASQVASIEAACQARGWDLAGIEQDQASGRKTTKRPGFQRALEACRSGRIDGIIAAKVDRLSRSVIDFGRLLEDGERHGFAVIALDLGADTTTASGRLVASVLSAVAEWEARVIGERTKAALAVVKANGSKTGRPVGNPRFCPVSDDVRARIMELHAAGRSFSSIAEQLNAEQVPTAQGGRWHGCTVSRIERRESIAA